MEGIENRLKSLKQTIIYELLKMKIANLSRDATGLTIQQHHSHHDDLERIDRLRSLSDRIDYQLQDSFNMILRRILFPEQSIDELRKLEDEVSATLNKRSVVGRVHLPNSESGTINRREFIPKVHIDRDHLVDINQLEISESLTIDSTKNTAEDCTENRETAGSFNLPSCSRNLRGNTPLEQKSLTRLLKRSESSPSLQGTGEIVPDKGNREIAGLFTLPSSSRDLEGNTRLKQKSLTCKGFMCYVGESLVNIPPIYRRALLVLCGSYLISQMKNNTDPFENSRLKRTTNAPTQQLLLTFGEAFETFLPEITHITQFLLCIILTTALILRLHLGMQIILCMFLLIPAFCFFLLELAHNASKTGVACGSIKLPLFWFTTLGAVGISFMFMLATLLLFNIRWRLSKGKPRVEDLDDASLDVLSETLQG